MSAALRVLAPGLLTTVQDLGRPGYQRLGVPVSGALDPVSLRAANILVGNPADVGAIEVAYLGPTLVVEAEEALLSFVGAQATIDILPDETASVGRRVDVMRTVLARHGEVVRIGSLSGAAVLYVAVEGGFDIQPVLGSVSTSIRGRLGGLHGRAIVAGDRLPLARNTANRRGDCRLEGLDLRPPKRFRVIAGPQSDYFSEETFARFLASDYTIQAGSDRMGMRLDGERLDHLQGFNITSDAIAAGSIQVPGNGQPIVLLADRQTTGGYPKIATVISADLPALGRLPIGAKLSFEQVTAEAAEAARRKLFADIGRLEQMIVPITGHIVDLTAKLHGCNLTSGVVDALDRAV